ncbi:MAG: type II CRISPR RNA-guided endonuclease Cas9, partial [Clostridia bacterium]|nr:type II CRISPR RNA-guided endonuclease Cas9 [Clostridia bacterium]
LKNHFQNIGLLNDTFNDDFENCRDDDVYLLKVKGLDGKLEAAELFKCLAHTCNHRGYKDFYEPDDDDEDEESGVNEKAANLFEKEFAASGKRTVSEYLVEKYFKNGFVKFRNRSGADAPYMLIRRSLLKDEAEKIINKQSEYYPCLGGINAERTVSIIFSQRDFEDGPGDPNDPHRRYQGFLETLGRCPYYKDEKRGFRGTVISDVFAVTNTLSQYVFFEKETGECRLDPQIANELVSYLLTNAGLTMTEVKKILKSHGYELQKNENSDDKAISKAVKFLSIAKKCVEEAGKSWEALISEDQFDAANPSTLHRIGELISKFQTPSRRVQEMKKSGIDGDLIKAFSGKKISGTSSVSYKYMTDSINAFLSGDIYGNFQANFIKENAAVKEEDRSYKLEPRHIDDPEVRDNRVVFKAINETRKVVNAIIDIYGSPEDIVIEVASELGKSVEARIEETKRQRANEKENDRIKSEIAKLLSIDVQSVKTTMIERYKLYNIQEGKCAYSLEPLGDLKDVVENVNKVYEIDHIVPFSLILDNTLNNKALVFTRENQLKGQRTPLRYLSEEKAKEFLAFSNHLFSKKTGGISKTKLEYLKLETIYGEAAAEKLNAWKSRNINDTRYITKYIAGLFDKQLIFAGDKKQHVFTVKGSVTQRFRREWFRGTEWGKEEKDRDTYLNHALDALVAANLTKAYIEIGSDAMKLTQIYRAHRYQITEEYESYLDKCVKKMSKYYGFSEGYTKKLLSKPERIPSFVPRLKDEVAVRFNDSDREAFDKGVSALYSKEAPFIDPPHIPITSHKQNKKFKGCIADSNPVRVEEIGGEIHKIRRIDVKTLKAENLKSDKKQNKKQKKILYTGDVSLREELEAMLGGKPDNYSVGDRLKELGKEFFTSKNGTVIRKVSVDDGVISNYYRKEIKDGQFSNLGMLKYYCIEIYKNKKGETCLYGLRFVDIIKKNKKLYQKEESYPQDYASHVMYLFPGDFILIADGNGELKFEGTYSAVYNINENRLYVQNINQRKKTDVRIAKKDIVEKYYIDLLGRMGGKIKCSEPLQSTAAKRSL